MRLLGKVARQTAEERAEEIAAAKAVIEAKFRLAQIGVSRVGRARKGRRVVFVLSGQNR